MKPVPAQIVARLRSLPARQDGQAMVFLVMLLAVLVMAVVIGVNIARETRVRMQIQSVSDLAAISAANSYSRAEDAQSLLNSVSMALVGTQVAYQADWNYMTALGYCLTRRRAHDGWDAQLLQRGLVLSWDAGFRAVDIPHVEWGGKRFSFGPVDFNTRPRDSNGEPLDFYRKNFYDQNQSGLINNFEAPNNYYASLNWAFSSEGSFGQMKRGIERGSNYLRDSGPDFAVDAASEIGLGSIGDSADVVMIPNEGAVEWEDLRPFDAMARLNGQREVLKATQENSYPIKGKYGYILGESGGPRYVSDAKHDSKDWALDLAMANTISHQPNREIDDVPFVTDDAHTDTISASRSQEERDRLRSLLNEAAKPPRGSARAELFRQAIRNGKLTFSARTWYMGFNQSGTTPDDKNDLRRYVDIGYKQQNLKDSWNLDARPQPRLRFEQRIGLQGIPYGAGKDGVPGAYDPEDDDRYKPPYYIAGPSGSVNPPPSSTVADYLAKAGDDGRNEMGVFVEGIDVWSQRPAYFPGYTYQGGDPWDFLTDHDRKHVVRYFYFVKDFDFDESQTRLFPAGDTIDQEVAFGEGVTIERMPFRPGRDEVRFIKVQGPTATPVETPTPTPEDTPTPVPTATPVPTPSPTPVPVFAPGPPMVVGLLELRIETLEMTVFYPGGEDLQTMLKAGLFQAQIPQLLRLKKRQEDARTNSTTIAVHWPARPAPLFAGWFRKSLVDEKVYDDAQTSIAWSSSRLYNANEDGMNPGWQTRLEISDAMLAELAPDDVAGEVPTQETLKKKFRRSKRGGLGTVAEVESKMFDRLEALSALLRANNKKAARKVLSH